MFLQSDQRGSLLLYLKLLNHRYGGDDVAATNLFSDSCRARLTRNLAHTATFSSTYLQVFGEHWRVRCYACRNTMTFTHTPVAPSSHVDAINVWPPRLISNSTARQNIVHAKQRYLYVLRSLYVPLLRISRTSRTHIHVMMYLQRHQIRGCTLHVSWAISKIRIHCTNQLCLSWDQRDAPRRLACEMITSRSRRCRLIS